MSGGGGGRGGEKGRVELRRISEIYEKGRKCDGVWGGGGGGGDVGR